MSERRPAPKPGDELRDLSARLLGFRYGEPKIEKRVDGKKVDTFFEFSELGKKHRLYVEAKEYARNLSRKEVVEIYSDYSGILERSRPSQLLIVTDQGVSTDAEMYISEERFDLAHRTISELERSVLGLDEYINEISKVFERDGLSQYYVESKARKAIYSGDTNSERSISAQSEPMFSVIQEWISDEQNRPIAILGGYGAGKSSFAKRLASHFAKIAMADSAAPIPVLIRLGQFSRAAGIESLISSMFSREFPIRNFNIAVFLDCVRRGRFVIICDGFDEMKHAMTWSDFRATIAEMNRLNEGLSRMVLLGRPNAFLSSDEHLQVLRGLRKFGPSYRKLVDWPEFHEWELAEFDKNERTYFIEKYLQYLASKSKDSASEVEQERRIAKVSELADSEPELFSKPVHAQILTELALQPTFDIDQFKKGITRWDLYEAFFAHLAEREALKEARRPISEKKRMQFLSSLAYWLWTEKGGLTSFSIADLPESIFHLVDLEESDDPETRLREYLTGAFLEKKDGDIFYFGHRSFAEFLVASHLVNSRDSSVDHGQFARILNGSVLDFFEEGLGDRSLRSWAMTLSAERGLFDFQYCRLLSRYAGGFRAVKQQLPGGSLASSILGCFGDNVNFGPLLEKSLYKLARQNSVKVILASLAVMDISLAKRELKRDGIDRLSLAMVARLLDDNSALSKGVLRSDKDGKRVFVDGLRARSKILEELKQHDIEIVDSGGIAQSEGWPSSFEVARTEMLSLDPVWERQRRGLVRKIRKIRGHDPDLDGAVVRRQKKKWFPRS